jgi:hypothetical protein
VRFPSRLDGNACVALFESRGSAILNGAVVALTDPPPDPLINVARPWRLVLEPAAGSSDADGLILGSFGGQLTIGQFLVGRIQRGLTVFSTSPPADPRPPATARAGGDLAYSNRNVPRGPRQLAPRKMPLIVAPWIYCRWMPIA